MMQLTYLLTDGLHEAGEDIQIASGTLAVLGVELEGDLSQEFPRYGRIVELEPRPLAGRRLNLGGEM